MKLDWILNETLPDSVMKKMQTAADQCLIAEGIGIPCAVTVRLCSDEEISLVNAETRKISSSTDVLSFPTCSFPDGLTAGSCEKLLRREYDDDMNACFLGDIMISVPHLMSQAMEYGHSPEREGAYLLVHGICHLMGYDHIKPEDKERMRKMEEKILSTVSVSRDDQPDSVDDTLLMLAREAMKNSYSPYSSYPVGAALHCTDGRIFTGCNVENASFGLSNCAERTALFKAVSEGAREFDVIAIAAKTKPWPCGACRQVLNEFAPDIRVIVTWKDHVEEKKLHELLPESFGPDSM